MIQEMNDQRLFINHGPIQMLLDLTYNNKKQPEMAQLVAQDVIKQFEAMLSYMSEIKAHKQYNHIPDNYTIVFKKMIMAVKQLEDESFSPLAAVAGSFSEYALEKSLEYGAQRVIINNGGDIALKDITGKPIVVGIPLETKLSGQQLIMSVTENMGIEGICTSGFGGRSFTKGIATKAVAFCEKASVADVCATYIGNMTNVDDPHITRVLAEEIDSGTDIAGQLVTLKIGQLSRKSQLKALLNGYNAVEALYNKSIIKGGAIVLGQDIMMIPENIAKTNDIRRN